jgi:hypothetical protein
MELAQIISGGQTGTDRGALDAALAWGFPCGGWCPPERLAEEGRIPERYPVIEIKEGGYRQRTLRNVLENDGTAILYFSQIEDGTEETLLFCINERKPSSPSPIPLKLSVNSACENRRSGKRTVRPTKLPLPNACADFENGLSEYYRTHR